MAIFLIVRYIRFFVWLDGRLWTSTPQPNWPNWRTVTHPYHRSDINWRWRKPQAPIHKLLNLRRSSSSQKPWPSNPLCQRNGNVLVLGGVLSILRRRNTDVAAEVVPIGGWEMTWYWVSLSQWGAQAKRIRECEISYAFTTVRISDSPNTSRLSMILRFHPRSSRPLNCIHYHSNAIGNELKCGGPSFYSTCLPPFLSAQRQRLRGKVLGVLQEINIVDIAWYEGG